MADGRRTTGEANGKTTKGRDAPPPTTRRVTLSVDELSRVEGEGAMRVKVEDGRVVESRLEIFEPPRFFEALLRGRRFDEAPDVTARICGICPVAYQMSSCQAMEAALGVEIDGPVRDLRRLLYCGEWIESHALHVHLLHAPDFLGYEDSIEMAADHPDAVKRGLEMKKIGNGIVTLVGGREIHPVNVKVGGFYRAPTRSEIAALAEPLARGRDAALEAVRWTAGLEFPDVEIDAEYVALVHPDEYAVLDGRIASTAGLEIDVADWPDHFVEEHVEWSNALHSRIVGRGAYLTGPLARYALSREKLRPIALEAAEEAGLPPVVRNPFRSIVVRAVEILHAFDQALSIVEAYEEPERPAAAVDVGAGGNGSGGSGNGSGGGSGAAAGGRVGHAATEAPRGILYHRYELAVDGTIADAVIVPPTSQNQASIEADLVRTVEASLDLPEDDLGWRCEQLIRCYDPCISCATHFLTLEIERA